MTERAEPSMGSHKEFIIQDPLEELADLGNTVESDLSPWSPSLPRFLGADPALRVGQ